MLVLCLDHESWSTPPTLPPASLFFLLFFQMCLREREGTSSGRIRDEVSITMYVFFVKIKSEQEESKYSFPSSCCFLFSFNIFFPCSSSFLRLSWKLLLSRLLNISHLLTSLFHGIFFSRLLILSSFSIFPFIRIFLDFKAKLFTISHLRDFFWVLPLLLP